MNYKGIDKEKILEVQKVKLPFTDKNIILDFSVLNKGLHNLEKAVLEYSKKVADDTEMAIICEMAMMYLDSLKAKEAADKEAYNKGLNVAWGLAKKLWLPLNRGGLPSYEVKKIFECDYFAIAENYTPQEALAKLEAYEKEQAEIKVGDVVLYKKEGVEIVITRIYGNSFDGVKVKSDQCGIAGATYYSRNLCDCKKTGKHIDIQKILDELKEGTE